MNSKKQSLDNMAHLTVQLTIAAIEKEKVGLLHKYGYHADKLLTSLQNAPAGHLDEMYIYPELLDSLENISYCHKRLLNKRLTAEDTWYLYESLLGCVNLRSITLDVA